MSELLLPAHSTMVNFEPINWPSDLLPVTAQGLNRLFRVAHPVLVRLFYVRQLNAAPDMEQLRQDLVDSVIAFEAGARELGVELEALAAARYALCAFLDETVSLTAWGRAGEWGQASLLARFHHETFGGERFFVILRRLTQQPARYVEVLELFYLCLTFGFSGQYRLASAGQGQLKQIRERLSLLIGQQRGRADSVLSSPLLALGHAPSPAFNRRQRWGIGLSLFMLAALCWLLADNLQTRAVPVLQQLNLIRWSPLPGGQSQPLFEPFLTSFLQDEIAAGWITVTEKEQQSRILLHGESLFASGSDRVAKSYLPVLQRIGDALRLRPGQVVVRGHTDDSPSLSARFPSNQLLSEARAHAIARVLMAQSGVMSRFRVEGLADRQPMLANSSDSNRARNRRVEILLRPLSDNNNEPPAVSLP
ncbi:type VI secretion system protein TssL, long form [Chromobacterium haemolyticum]|uniref:OmpA-like domain-containing protein n=1 Tax=Chromobacterium haemolyticum TaxID=394935 RepID=A0A1W0CE85_9NEIS|nr:type VI secretion system protein TssL, long form [Chromobacterium haemolyticum]OQS32961.1 hypothetical protein B0T45_21025 [Chromobacterium haemolyticum]